MNSSPRLFAVTVFVAASVLATPAAAAEMTAAKDAEASRMHDLEAALQAADDRA